MDVSHRSLHTPVLAPDGSTVTPANLPPPDTRRWVASRKAILVAAVRGGLLSIDEACRRYALTVDEFQEWQAGYDRDGLHGLKISRIQDRHPESRHRD